METKDKLLIYKSALETLLKNIGVISPIYVLGLCHLATKVLNTEQCDIFDKYIDSYAMSIGTDADHFLWPIGEQKPRKQWLESELEKVNLKLKEYESNNR